MPAPPKPKDAYDAFNSVDKLVSKPILGSDGAASWQEFRKDNTNIFSKKPSVAPLAPLKKADKLGSGLTSWEDERAREHEARKETGSAALGAGYTDFKAKNGQEEAQARKERKRIEQRKRPDNQEYFIAAKTFGGWKWDYIFTSRDRGTGYYWDGMDSIKRINGEWPSTAGPDNLPTSRNNNQQEEGQEEEPRGKHERPESETGDDPKEKKKKKRKKAAPVILEDPNNPLEQVQAAIRKRNERLGLGTAGLPTGWEGAPDPSTGKTYYFNRQTGERQWEKPKRDILPEGWSTANDPNTGKQYYFHTSGETRWEKPT